MSHGAPVCRRVQERTILDIMPLDKTILGFSNRWLEAFTGALPGYLLPDDASQSRIATVIRRLHDLAAV